VSEIISRRLDEKSAGIAALLSFFSCGAGQLYSGNVERGVTLFVIHVVGWILGVASGGVFFLVLLPFWLWAVIDASSEANKYNDRVKSEERQRSESTRQAEIKASSTTDTKDFTASLEKFSKLHAAQLLSDDEFAARKKALILILAEKKPRDQAEDFLAALIPSIERGHLDATEIAQIKRLVF